MNERIDQSISCESSLFPFLQREKFVQKLLDHKKILLCINKNQIGIETVLSTKHHMKKKILHRTSAKIGDDKFDFVYYDYELFETSHIFDQLSSMCTYTIYRLECEINKA